MSVYNGKKKILYNTVIAGYTMLCYYIIMLYYTILYYNAILYYAMLLYNIILPVLSIQEALIEITKCPSFFKK